jgi:hypothetical protein
LWEEAERYYFRDVSQKEFRTPVSLYVTLKENEFHLIQLSKPTTPKAILDQLKMVSKVIIAAHFIPNWTPETTTTRINHEKEDSSSIVWELNRPLESGGLLSFIDFDSSLGQSIFWHSSAHVLGQVIPRSFSIIYSLNIFCFFIIKTL